MSLPVSPTVALQAARLTGQVLGQTVNAATKVIQSNEFANLLSGSPEDAAPSGTPGLESTKEAGSENRNGEESLRSRVTNLLQELGVLPKSGGPASGTPPSNQPYAPERAGEMVDVELSLGSGGVIRLDGKHPRAAEIEAHLNDSHRLQQDLANFLKSQPNQSWRPLG